MRHQFLAPQDSVDRHLEPMHSRLSASRGTISSGMIFWPRERARVPSSRSLPVVRWSPSIPLSRRKQFLVGRMARTDKLFAFENRHELFDDAFQSELEAMSRDSGEGKQPVSPALLAMIILLQAYMGASDAQAGDTGISPASDCARHGPSPLERTTELATQTSGSDWEKLPKQLRLAVDSRPLEGAGASRTPSTCSRTPRERCSSARRIWSNSRPSRSLVTREHRCS